MAVEARRAARVRATLASLGIDAVDVAPIADAAPWSRSPRSFRVTGRDGAVVKVRLMRGPHRAARAVALAAALDDPRVPVPIGRVGSATVERWVHGTSLAATRLTRAHVDSAADLLAAIHRHAGGAEALPRPRRVGPVVVRARTQLSELVRAGKLERSDADALRGLVQRGMPADSPWGLTHNDLCAGNLVVADGTLVSVDNELLCRGFLEYDLARVWYRWPMPAWAMDRFERRYRAARGPASSPGAAEKHAWRVVATLRGAHLRHRVGGPVTEALAALRRLTVSP